MTRMKRFKRTCCYCVLALGLSIQAPAVSQAAPAAITKSSQITSSVTNIDTILFDAAYYYDNNADVAKSSYGKNASTLKSHYEKYGKKEGRRPSALFDPVYYLNKYPDLKKAYGNNYTSAYKHFARTGIREGRQGSADFNVEVYKNNYLDLQKAFGTKASDNWKYLRHYRIRGKIESRNATSMISSLSISGHSVPSVISKGSGFSVKGTVSSNTKIKMVTVRILSPTGGTVSGKTIWPNAKSYDLKKIDNDIKFGQAPVGKCRYQVIATDEATSNKVLLDASFEVRNSNAGGNTGNSGSKLTGKRKMAIDYAKSQLGKSNGRLYGPTSNNWCVYFATKCLKQAGVVTSTTGSTNGLIAYYQKQGRWHNKVSYKFSYNGAVGTGIVDTAYNPKPGDIIAVENNNLKDKEPDHTGIVVDVNAKTITAIEGNTGTPRQVRYRYYDARTLKRTDAQCYIVGFSSPNYGD